MDDTIRKSQHLLAAASGTVEKIEKGMSTDFGGVELHLEQATAMLNEVQRDVSGVAKLRTEQLRDEATTLAQALHRLKTRHDRQQYQRAQREELLASVGGGGPGSHHSLRNAQDATSLLSKEEQSLRHTRTKVRGMLEESSAVLSALRGQGRRIEGTQSKLGDFMESLGMSNQTLLQIVRTNRVDAWLVYCGALLLIVIMLYLWFWV